MGKNKSSLPCRPALLQYVLQQQQQQQYANNTLYRNMAANGWIKHTL